MEFLPEVDDELDYNEEELLAPSAREGDRYRGGGATHMKSNSQGQRLLSPREEGEEEDEEDDEEETGGNAAESRQGHAAKRRQHRHHHPAHDREEGEASSEDDQRRSRMSSTVEENSFRKTKQSGSQLLLDEAEYRHRLHERHERRERERLHSGRSHKRQKSNASTRDLKSDFPLSRSNSAAEQSVTNAHPESSSETLQGEKKWQVHPSASSDKDHRRGACDVPYREDGKQDSTKKSKQKRTDELETEEVIDSHLISSDVVHRSHSTSFLPYGHATVGEMQYHIEALTERTKKKAKVKRSKRDHHDKSEESSKKGTRPYSKINSAGQIVVYADWESYVREKSKRHSQIPTSPHSSNSSSRQSSASSSHSVISTSSSSSSKSPTHRDRLDTSNSRKRLSTQATATYENPQSLVYVKHKRSHKYRRETREGAPLLESGKSQVLDSESGRRHKSEKHSLKLSTQSVSYPSKRSRTAKDVRNKEDPDLDLTRYHNRDTSESRSHVKSRVTTEGVSRDSQSSELQASSEETASMRLLKRRAAISSRSPFKDEPVSNCSDESVGKRPPISNNSSELPVKSKGEVEEESVMKQLPKPSRFQQYRLYSESDSDDDDEEEEEDNEGDDGEDDEDVDDRENADPDHRVKEHEVAKDAADTVDVTRLNSSEHRTQRVPSKPFYFPSIQGCRSVEEFECLNRIEEGTYGVVYRARDRKINEIVALKRLKMEKERDGFPITSLREINTLMKAQHENIVTVREVVVGSNMDKIYLVMDYVEHDLKSLMEIMNGPFSVGEVKCLLVQLLRAVRHLHDNWILHRDLKTSNLLLSHQGILKVGDFGLAREYGSPLKHYTEVVVTLWYRAPELLLGTKQYTCPIDLWSVGCIFAEFLLQRPLFPGKGEVDELNIIFRDLGTPTERIWPGVSQLPGMKKCVFTDYPYNQLRRRFTEKQISDQGFDLLNSFLTYCPDKRVTAEKALNHAYFSERPRAIHPSMFPSWPAKSEGAVSSRKMVSPRPPAGGGALAAAAAAVAAASAASSGSNRVRYQPPAPPMGGQRFYSSMGEDSRPGTAVGSGDLVSGSLDKGFLLRF
ncbi:Serine/threonine-protein kinase PITSLRE [Paragonimus heterotremus]|uniref:cyclin-dependent kinase n=1 Tax=Paragonimus heterotremus TaxID=100268 RepID=A0A8J4TBR5_9TREM|nr:Serine/threonine-protein kinase PITSLRE [Paragonimus heterotremus]